MTFSPSKFTFQIRHPKLQIFHTPSFIFFLISKKIIEEFDIRQKTFLTNRIFYEKSFRIRKYDRFSPVLEALKVDK